MSEEGSPQKDPVRTRAAEHLIYIARDLRTAGDPGLVRLTEDGVADAEVTLAGELELIAMGLDYAACMRLAGDMG